MSQPVLVLGGGLAGVACAQALAESKVSVTLVDRNDYNQFQPLLYQVATSQIPVEDIARPLRAIFREFANVDVVSAEVSSADFEERELTLVDGRVLSGEALVFASGALPNFFGVPGAEDHAFPLYSVVDAERLRLHLQRLIVDRSAHPDKGAKPPAHQLDVVVVGAGPTGVETAGALAELMVALTRTGAIDHAGQITLVDHGPKLLAPYSDKAHEYAHRKLTEARVDVRLGTSVTKVSQEGVDLDDAHVPARTVVWAGGEAAARVPWLKGPPPGRGGRIDVNPDLSVPGFPGTYAIGDIANVSSGEGPPLPQLGSVAQQSGAWAAENILRLRAGEKSKPFRYKDKGIMAMIGRNAAIAEVGAHRHQVDGPVAFAAWLGVHALLLSGVHARTDAFMSWAWDYFDRDHAATVESTASPQRIFGGDDDERPTIVID
ncbi:MAG TPA: NAD(P)/FAD-dependent oxidoreductase [Actinomycetes bacterium]|nr:NAD(P)/FAD-dependent oxidoreductase [Actinomycetes bacterium]